MTRRLASLLLSAALALLAGACSRPAPDTWVGDYRASLPRLPQLNGIHGYPTTIFIDRKGLVRHIHTGFSGPATGDHYTGLARDFEDRVRALLAENA